jgi:hypothetical protein
MIEGSYGEAAEAYSLAATEAERGTRSEAMFSFLATVLAGLAEKRDARTRLRRDLAALTRRFQRGAWRRIGALSRAILDGHLAAVDDALFLFSPTDAAAPCLFLYLSALVFERTGMQPEAKAAYRRCIESDRTRLWPVVLAERRLKRMGRRNTPAAD